MRQTRKPRVYVALPRGPGRLRPFLWVVWSCAVLVGFCGAGYTVLQAQIIPSYRSYTGELRPTHAPSTLSLPTGAFVDEVLVERNEVVRKGQTLITLDTEAMATRLRLLDEDLRQDRLLQHCLLSDPDALNLSSVLDSDPPQETETPPVETGLSLTLETCATHHQQAQAVELELQETLAVLDEEKSLIEQYIRLLTAPRSEKLPSEEEEKIARQALAFALARNQLDAQRVALHQKARTALADLQATRVRRAQEIAERLQAGEALRAQLQAHLAVPRLQAPESGQVVRVRHLPSGTEIHEETEILEVRPKKTRGYAAHFTIPPEHLEGLEQGAEVRLQLYGMPGQRGLLRGAIDAVSLDVAGRPQASVVLDEDSTTKLDDPRTGIALRGPGTASVIYVRRSDLDPVETLSLELFKGVIRTPSWLLGDWAGQLWARALQAVDVTAQFFPARLSEGSDQDVPL